MAKKEAYDEFVSLSEKLTHLVEIHGNKKLAIFLDMKLIYSTMLSPKLNILKK